MLIYSGARAQTMVLINNCVKILRQASEVALSAGTMHVRNEVDKAVCMFHQRNFSTKKKISIPLSRHMLDETALITIPPRLVRHKYKEDRLEDEPGQPEQCGERQDSLVCTSGVGRRD